MLEESPLNTSDGSPNGSNDGPPEGAFLGASLEGITSVSFRRLLGGYNYGSQWSALLGASLEEYGCGADSWGLF